MWGNSILVGMKIFNFSLIESLEDETIDNELWNIIHDTGFWNTFVNYYNFQIIQKIGRIIEQNESTLELHLVYYSFKVFYPEYANELLFEHFSQLSIPKKI